MIKLKDSGTREEYPSGAHRDNPIGKGRTDLIPPEPLLRLSRHYEAGAIKYGEGNWQKGIPNSRYIDSAFRHLLKYMTGCNDEPHLEAVVWNIFCIMWNEQHRPDLQDLEAWAGRKSNFLYEVDLG